MNKYQDNKALLSQAEIDTLIRFLTSHQENVEDTILTQESIDKVIKILKQGEVQTLKYKFSPSSKKTINDMLLPVLIDVDLTGYILDANINDTTHLLEITAYNEQTHKRVPITPAAVEYLHLVEDNSSWGYCIEPILFNSIAEMFHLQYHQAAYNLICRTFAQNRFGDKDASIPYIYLPTSDSLIDTLIL